MNDQEKELTYRSTAEHEAAHAVAYLALGYPVYSIEAGENWVTFTAPEPVARPVYDVAVINMAGPVAEAHFHENGIEWVRQALAELTEFAEWEDPDDWAGDDLALFIEHPSLFEGAIQHSQIILEANAEMHAEITAALLASPTHSLSQDDIYALPIAGAKLRQNDQFPKDGRTEQ